MAEVDGRAVISTGITWEELESATWMQLRAAFYRAQASLRVLAKDGSTEARDALAAVAEVFGPNWDGTVPRCST